MKKVFSIFVVLCLLFSFAACGGDSDNSDSSVNSSVVSSTTISTEDVSFIGASGDSVYTIVSPKDEKMDEGKRVSYIYKQMKDKLSVNVKNTTDESDGTDAYEILIGNTNRPESKQALDYLKSKSGGRYDDYIICTIGKKIVINAYNTTVLETACKSFIDNFVKKEGVKGGIDFIFAKEGNWQNITINGVSIGEFSIVRPHFNSSYLTQLEMEKIVSEIYKITGYMLQIVDDKYVKAGNHEIIVGNTDRDGVKTISGYDTYDVSISGTKVYLNGGSAHATSMAVSEFAKMLYKGTVTDANSVNNADYNTALKNYNLSTTYRPVYYDNFDGDAIDSTKWRLMKGTEFRKDGQNGKLSGMTDDPNYVFVRDGKFWIYGHEDDKSYYGGTLVNDKTMRFHYGYVEHSVICPDGDGFWSLLWFDNRGDEDNVLFGAEIDLNECFGNGSATQANCHKWPTKYGQSMGYEHVSLDGATYGTAKKYYHPDNGTWADGYHTFGFLWDATQMSFTVDGKIFF
ncbi:MAG: glycoside hydrolase family 16 protein [Clostridia bacterium]|nr:glycoside hydrolase family 16 protein [Clostridia bacterium]